MTLAPLVDPSIRGVEGKPSVVTDRCVTPGCEARAQERHHLWPRSFLRGQPVEWVSVQDTVIPNVVGLCHHHHLQVTGTKGHLAHIRWNEGLKTLEWWENVGDYIDPDRWVSRGPLRGQGIVSATPEPARRKSIELCESCGRPKARPRPEREPGPKRKVKSWAISVPDDAEEGVEVLNVYIEDLGALMGFQDSRARLLRYHVLVPVLEWVNQNRVEFIRDWEEASE